MNSSDFLVPFNDLSRRFVDKSHVLEEVKNLIVSGPFFKSVHTQNFEINFAKYVGTNHCIAVSSGTAALEISMKSLELPRGSAVLMSANAGGYAALAAINSGLRPKFVDVTDNGLINSECLPSMSEGVSAIVVTHLYGQVCDMQKLINYAKSHGLKVIEDCAQSAGSSIDSLMSGSFGDISAFSFYPTKNLGGVGDGGAVCTNSKDLYENCLKLREYGWTDRYYSQFPFGSNFRMDEIQALILNYQLSTLDHKNGIRRIIWKRYSEICKKFNLHILGNSTAGFAPHLAVLRIPNRNRFADYMQSHGVGTSIHYPYPDYKQPGIGFNPGVELTVTETLCKEVVSLPLFPELSENEIQKVERILSEYLSHAYP